MGDSAVTRFGALPAVRWAVWLLLAVILILTVELWRPWSREVSVGSDDRLMIRVSEELAAGQWGQLLAPQDIHIIPLFRLVRVYFDLRFPERFQGMGAVVMATQLASTILLFALSRRYLESAWVALAAASLFAWSALGGEAILVKAESTYVVSLPFLLGGLYCISRIGSGQATRWAAGASLCLLAAVGLHSMPGLAAIPGVLVGYYLLSARSGQRSKTNVLLAWLACTAPVMIALALWLKAGERVPAAEHQPSFALSLESGRQALLRCRFGIQGVVTHFTYLIRRAPPGRFAEVTAGLALAALLFLVRRRRSFRWIATIAVFAAGPVFAFYFGWGAPEFQPSRYAYQSFVLVAAAGGAALDWLLASAARNAPVLRPAILSLLIVATPFYYGSQKRAVDLREAALHAEGSMSRGSWISWRHFFEAAAAGAQASSTEFRLPDSELRPKLPMRDVFYGCFPAGAKGIRVLARDDTHAGDCLNFRKAIVKARVGSGPLNREPLPAQLAIAAYADPVPSGDLLMCYAVARHGEPSLVPLAPGSEAAAAMAGPARSRP